MVYSFDVFDTLITRSTVTPTGIFAVMQRLMGDNGELDGFVKNHFYELRIGAEQVARNTYCRQGIEDVTLEQIYSVLVNWHKISPSQAVYLQSLERQTEIDYVYGIPQNIARLKGLVENHQKVLLISDMYLDADTIRKMLIKADPVFEEIPLYVSSDIEKKNKYSGNLFRLVKEKEHLEYHDWIHFGDNVHSDFEVPKSLGISCELYLPEQLQDIEKNYFKNGDSDAGKQLMLGAVKLARLRGEKNNAYILGCTIGGPMLCPYVKWLLEDCVKRGIQRLYFIARDGCILKEIADIWIRQENLPVFTRYIYGSRKAWRIPDTENLKNEITAIFEGAYKDRIFGLSDMADFFQVEEQALKEFLPEKLCDKQLVWNIPVVTIVLNSLLNHPDFLNQLCHIYDSKRKLLIEYLQQEVDVHDDKFAFVDLAGTGLTQEFLAKALGCFYKGKVKNYFYRLDQINNGICDYYVFYPNFIPHYVLLEMLCRAPHEQTIGYQKAESGDVLPVFSNVDAQAIINHQVPQFIEGAKQFAGIYEKVLNKNREFSGVINCILPYLNYIYNESDEILLDYFGDMPDMLTGREKQVMLYGPKLSDKEIKKIFWYRENVAPEYFYRGSSLKYSLLRCSGKQKRKIEQYKKFYHSPWGKFCRKTYTCFCGKSDFRTANVFDCIRQNIIIYGAGKVGQRFYRQITGKDKVNGIRYSSSVVLWVDRNYQEYQSEGMPVASPSEVIKHDYQQLIIAIAKKETADNIRKYLLELGVREEKIFWLRQ